VFSPLRAANLVERWENVFVIETRIERLSEVYFSRWRHLARLPFERIVVVDADTYFYRSPEHLLEKYDEFDFYAREDLGAQRSRESMYVGGLKFSPQVDWDIVDGQRRDYAAKDLPLYNVGVMVFNNHFADRLRPAVHLIQTLRRAWTDGTLPYPCTNHHIMDEIAASYAIGTVEGCTVGVLERRDVPFFVELEKSRASASAVHIWRANYKRFLVQEFGRSILTSFEEAYREDLLLRARLACAYQKGRSNCG